ncbi:class I SAM-dependent methyltransferase [Shinella yambaruensis]|uniref:Methyltransferase n=1 Tax=Shinella yambaruensis TaxID=415996 RepID=A0ABQ5ZMF6_9HYPH|nr:class I SAM-dependent methyltransferase [Shinella yambaruensis]MCJ8026525.1 class I SAM-dependent methyltransferase [Shinella yambaruensis]MCU7982319.1 class I SAM-dependent methyltransferase [Shinella yambaruensis]GLR51862.1 methyltransferase [Shinella yambaruensis]
MDEADRIAGLYERHADAFDRIRGRDLSEKPWLDRFTAPLAASLITRGFAVTGVDASQTLVGLCRARHPAHDWYVADMRGFAPGKTFAGILAWHSFFHLTPQDQRAMFPRFAAMAAPGAMLLFTSGPSQGVVVGTFQGEPLYHASLGGAEYRELLAANGFAVVEHRREDPDCGGATVWLARKSG